MCCGNAAQSAAVFVSVTAPTPKRINKPSAVCDPLSSWRVCGWYPRCYVWILPLLHAVGLVSTTRIRCRGFPFVVRQELHHESFGVRCRGDIDLFVVVVPVYGRQSTTSPSARNEFPNELCGLSAAMTLILAWPSWPFRPFFLSVCLFPDFGIFLGLFPSVCDTRP